VKETGAIPAHRRLAVAAAAVTAGAVVTADQGHRGETVGMTAGRDLGAGMTAGAQGHGPLFPRPVSSASPLLTTTVAAAAAAQWPKSGMTVMGTAAQGVMLAAAQGVMLATARHLLTTGRMPALPPTVVVPAPEMRIPTIMLITITGGVMSLLTVRRGYLDW
jgi:hypothetical protein